MASSLSPDLIALLVKLAESPDEAAVRTQLEPLLRDFQPVPGRWWTEFPLSSVLATLLWHGDQHGLAADIALKTVLRSGPDDAAMPVINARRQSFYQAAMAALHHKRPDLAGRFLQANVDAFGTLLDVSPERSLFQLMAFVVAVRQPPAPVPAPQGRPTVVNLGIWGDRFIAAAEKTFLPCCLAAGNFPELSKHGTIYLRIHTREEDVARILERPVVKALANHAVLDVRVIPEALLKGTHLFGRQFWSRMLIAALGYTDLMYARSLGADLMFGGADCLVSNRTYSVMKQRLIAGYRAVVIQPVRSIAGEVEKLVEAKGCRRDDGSFDIPSDILYRASLKALHPFILRSFMRTTPTPLPMDPIQFYFPSPTGFSLHSFQLSALGLAVQHLPADLECDYHTWDARLLADVLAGSDRDAACFRELANPGECYVVGLDEVGGVASFGQFELSPPAAVRSIQKWIGCANDIDHFEWAVRQKFEYPVPTDINLDLPADCRDEDGTIVDITRLLESARADILKQLAQYR